MFLIFAPGMEDTSFNPSMELLYFVIVPAVLCLLDSTLLTAGCVCPLSPLPHALLANSGTNLAAYFSAPSTSILALTATLLFMHRVSPLGWSGRLLPSPPSYSFWRYPLFHHCTFHKSVTQLDKKSKFKTSKCIYVYKMYLFKTHLSFCSSQDAGLLRSGILGQGQIFGACFTPIV